jgi:hypothetical protein
MPMPCYGRAMNRIGIWLAPLSCALCACTADREEYPSLARRPAERAGLPEAGSQTAPAAVDAAPAPLLSQLDRLVEQARIAHGRFMGRRGGNDLLAIADLESARSEAMIALADLDQIYAAARIADEKVAAIEAARTLVMTWIGEEDRILESLRVIPRLADPDP